MESGLDFHSDKKPEILHQVPSVAQGIPDVGVLVQRYVSES